MTGLQSHLLGDVRRERGTPAQVAEKDEFLRLGEHGMVVGALGIDPELEQASRTVERTRYTAFPFQFPDVSQVDENHLVRAQPADRFLGGNDLYPRLGSLDQLFVADFTDDSPPGARCYGLLLAELYLLGAANGVSRRFSFPNALEFPFLLSDRKKSNETDEACYETAHRPGGAALFACSGGLWGETAATAGCSAGRKPG